MNEKEAEKRMVGGDDFIGTRQDKSNAERFTALVNIAKALVDERSEFVGVLCDDVNDSRHRNCSVYIDLKNAGFTHETRIKDGLKSLLEVCDMVGYSTIGGTLRLCFSVYDVWNDGNAFKRPGFVRKEEEEKIEKMADAFMDGLSDEEIDEILNM